MRKHRLREADTGDKCIPRASGGPEQLSFEVRRLRRTDDPFDVPSKQRLPMRIARIAALSGRVLQIRTRRRRTPGKKRRRVLATSKIPRHTGVSREKSASGAHPGQRHTSL